MTTRPTPLHRPLTDATEALGQIEPAHAERLYKACEETVGRNVFRVDEDGRVLIADEFRNRLPICGGEALALGVVVGRFIHHNSSAVRETEREIKIIVEQGQSTMFGAYMIYPDGSRVNLQRRFIMSNDARLFALDRITETRPTIWREALAWAERMRGRVVAA